MIPSLNFDGAIDPKEIRQFCREDTEELVCPQPHTAELEKVPEEPDADTDRVQGDGDTGSEQTYKESVEVINGGKDGSSDICWHSYISPICGEFSTKQNLTKIGIWVRVADVIKNTQFGTKLQKVKSWLAP